MKIIAMAAGALEEAQGFLAWVKQQSFEAVNSFAAQTGWLRPPLTAHATGLGNAETGPDRTRAGLLIADSSWDGVGPQQQPTDPARSEPAPAAAQTWAAQSWAAEPRDSPW